MKYKNNPFNIRKGSSRWLGSISKPGDKFESFDTMEHGIRAFFIIMRTYSVKYGRNTIRSIITRFAPPNENDILSYINYICYHTGFSYDIPLTCESHYISLAICMAYYESNTSLRLAELHYVWKYFHIANKSFPSNDIAKVHKGETFDDLPF